MTLSQHDLRFDLLKEIGNIGMGNAATSLSGLLKDEKVNMLLPEVSVVSLGELPDHMGGPDSIVAGIYLKVERELHLYMIFILPLECARLVAGIVTDGYTDELDEMGLSAIMEVSNIVIAGYLNAFSDLAGLTLFPTPPNVAVDLAEAILGTILAEVEVAEDFVILIKTAFETRDSKIDGFISLIPAKDSFEAIYQKFLKDIS